MLSIQCIQSILSGLSIQKVYLHMHKLNSLCGVCNGWTWCGRQCKNAPVKKSVVEKAPWDLAEEKLIAEKKKKAERISHIDPVPPMREEGGEEPVRKTVKAKSGAKEKISIRLDREDVDWFRSCGHGWQVLIQQVLKAYIKTETDEDGATFPSSGKFPDTEREGW